MKSTLKTFVAVGSALALTIFAQNLRAEDQQDAGAGKDGKACAHHGEGHARWGERFHGPHDTASHLQKLSTELNLTADQQTSIKPILDAAQTRTKEIWKNESLGREEKHAQMKQVHDAVSGQIKGILTADQQKKFAELEQKHRGHWEKHRSEQAD